MEMCETDEVMLDDGSTGYGSVVWFSEKGRINQ